MGAHRTKQIALMATLAVLAGCVDERERPIQVECVSFDQDLGPLFDRECVECHGGAEPAGQYSLATYLGAIGDGSDDVPNALAGDETSVLVTTLDPQSADAVHQPFAAEAHPLVRQWVVDCDLRLSPSPIHEPGILNPRSEDFHGELLREAKYDFQVCAECHGEEFEGGAAEAPCTTCHERGPKDCTTCHAEDLLQMGAHAAHLDQAETPLSFQACGKCHQVPQAFEDPGHVLLEDGELDPPPPEISFGPLAGLTPEGAAREGAPVFQETTSTCDNVYCHGDVFADTNAALTEPGWLLADQASCGTCHGLPPSTHAPGQDQCSHCHQAVVGPDLQILASDLHVNGEVDFADPDLGCSGCHGSSENAAPPVDVEGRSSTDLVTVGAHQSHLFSDISSTIECSACHQVPASVLDEGHIDSPRPAEVFPPEILDASLAAVRGASPTWDRSTATCADVYCHGGGELASDSMPVWTRVRLGEAVCGTCHGIPPAGSPHSPTMTLTNCVGCHSATVDQFGGIIVSGPPEARTSEHIDGETDVVF